MRHSHRNAKVTAILAVKTISESTVVENAEMWGLLLLVYVSSEGQRTWQWMETVKEPTMKDHIETYSTPVLDPRELHIEQIFSPNRFDVLTILKALNVSIYSCSCFNFYHATLSQCGICCPHVSYLFVCLSAQSGTVPKGLKAGSRKQRHTIAQGLLVFWRQRSRRNSDVVTPNRSPNRSGIGSYQWFSTNISLYLRNAARSGHSYYGMIIGTCMCSIEWRYFQWPWVTTSYPKPPHFWYFVSPFISL